jgi:outer membrane protein OmpA-like peptidoglycan-associated protein
MEEEVFANEEIGEFVNAHYISIRVDAEHEEQQLVKKHNINVYPTLAYYDANGKRLQTFEGALEVGDFLKLSEDMVYMKSYADAYKKSSRESSAVKNYASALHWSKPDMASKIVTTYLNEIPRRKWAQAENWELIKTYVSHADQKLMNDVFNHDGIAKLFPSEYKAFLQQSIGHILDSSLKSKKSYHLVRYIRYVEGYHQFFNNADSLILTARIRYAEVAKPALLPNLLKTYVDQYENGDHAALARHAYYLTQHFFQRDIMALAIKWSKESIGQSDNGLAYMTAGLAYEKLNEFNSAYAYMLLAKEYADVDMVDEHLARIDNKMHHQISEGVSTTQNVLKVNDGRFTLGVGNKRLMYGYPLPTSTSHFIVNVNGKLATNSPRLAAKGLEYLMGNIKYEGAGGTPEIYIDFNFQGTQITQELIPVDKHCKPIEGGLAQYYMVKYKFKNLGNKNQIIGLGMLFDTMVDDNDECVIEADGQILTKERAFSAKNMPEQLLFYRTAGDTTDMMGAAVLVGNEATKPDKLVIGRWPVLHEVTWHLKAQRERYHDSAYFLQWENRKLRPGDELVFATYYGLPAHKKAALSILVEDQGQLTLKAKVFFQTGVSTLDLNAQMIISDLLEKKDIVITGALLNGHADVMGGESNNFELSQKRIDNVGKLLTAHGIPYVPKPYGNDQSVRNVYNEAYGNVWDRKVEVVIYYKVKGEELLSANGN